MKMHATYFPNGEDWKIFTDKSKLVAEGFNSKSAANEYIAEHTGEDLYDIYVVWNREFDWTHYSVYLGKEGLEEYKYSILFQGDGSRVKKVKAVKRWKEIMKQ